MLPAMVGALALAMIAGAVYLPFHGDRAVGIAPTVFLVSLAGLAIWLVWKILGTVWLVGRAIDNTLVCRSARRQWLLCPNEIVAVKGDAYGLFLVLVTKHGKLWLWDGMEDREGLLAAIRRSSPSVHVDRYADRRRP